MHHSYVKATLHSQALILQCEVIMFGWQSVKGETNVNYSHLETIMHTQNLPLQCVITMPKWRSVRVETSTNYSHAWNKLVHLSFDLWSLSLNGKV